MNLCRTLRLISIKTPRFFSSNLSTLNRNRPLILAVPSNDSGIRFLHISRFLLDYPSNIKVALPALSPTMESGTIVSWQKKEGDQLSEGDLLCEIETDKATMGFETPEEGFLAKIIIPEGAKDVPIGKLLCIIVANQEDVAAFKDFKVEEASADKVAPKELEKPTPGGMPPAQKESQKSAQQPSAPSPATDQQRLKASPYAKKLALEQGIDLSTLSGSGPSGRILSSDLSGARQQPAKSHATSSTAAFVDIPLSNMRKTIAKRLSEAKSSIPHYYLTSELHIDKLLAIRKKLNGLLEKEAKKKGEKAQKLSINDFIIKASALACLRVPEANSSFMDTFIRQHSSVDVSVAVSTDVGLITPIVFNAHTKGVATISQEVHALAMKAREGKLQPHEFQGGTFTVSNLGMFGSVDHFTAIINPPQSCILAIGAARRLIVPLEEEEKAGSMEPYRAVTSLKVTLSCDHRVVDGAIGAVWLQNFKLFMEDPYTMLLWGTPGKDSSQ